MGATNKKLVPFIVLWSVTFVEATLQWKPIKIFSSIRKFYLR